ncbi:PucR family transcriptional regulator [Pseudonocardia sp. CA-107938]|uniref:PucR family transcriptional regulator n=1 Tax=Pseudonocardia sp. CA-107938 TaxID=3240021 RepID=UPI003D8C7F9B
MPAGDHCAYARDVVATCHRISAAVARGADPAAVAEILAAGLGAPVTVLDGARVVAAVGPVLGLSDGVLAAIPVGAGHVVVGGPPSDLRQLAAEHAALACAVAGGSGGAARRDLVEALLLGRRHDDGEVERWAAHLGHDGRPHAVAVLAGEPSVAEAVVRRRAPDAIVAARVDELVVIVAADDGPAAVDRAVVLAERAGRPAGIGEAHRRAVDVARSYGEARRALAVAQRAGSGQVVAFRDLGVNRLLARFPDAGELRSFGEEVIGRLLDEEAATGMPYLATLVAYFQVNSSPSQAARRLHVHPNTIAYRLRRIEELTGLRLGVQRDRLMAEVAVEIVEGLGRA